ncbi:hypothetical protein GQ53DRAFT_723716 [Thozetella sp. PMI_491]|nr:hypothetical protein GQ53DRAFT_723716 [Thozetella sp. PMI_491]
MARQASRPFRRLATSALLLVAAATVYLYTTVYSAKSPVAWLKDRLRLHISITPSDSNSDGNPVFGAEPQDDHDGLQSLLRPERHVYRESTTIRMQWNITQGHRRPDGVERLVYLINGHFPGPTIETRSGDRVEIQVFNSVDDDDGISIHWHGLSQKGRLTQRKLGANEMDGVPGVTQCSIGFRQNFTYSFRIEDAQSGTFWYHAHSGVHRADGLYGGFIVHKPKTGAQLVSAESPSEDYEAEQLLLVGDWYHRNASDVLAWYQDYENFGNDPAPDSLLINGRGYFNCSMAVKARPVDCLPVEKPSVKLYASRVRLRIVNTGAIAGFTLGVPNDATRAVEVDGGCPLRATPWTHSVGVLYPGERMDVVVERRAGVSPTLPLTALRRLTQLIRVKFRPLKFKNFALTRIQSFALSWAIGSATPARTSSGASGPEPVNFFDLSTATGLSDIEIPLDSETAVFYTKIEILASHGNIPLGVVNRTSWKVPSSRSPPLIVLDRKEWGEDRIEDGPPRLGAIHRHIPWFPNTGEQNWMTIVLNNLDDRGHPFHFVSHGYSFYVVATRRSQSGQYEVYNPLESAKNISEGLTNSTNYLRKDTIYVPRMGYVVLKFPLNNNGLWLLHCHALWHQAAGMGIVLQVGNLTVSDATRQLMKDMCTV